MQHGFHRARPLFLALTRAGAAVALAAASIFVIKSCTEGLGGVIFCLPVSLQGFAHVSPGCAWTTRCVLRDYGTLLQ